MKKVMFVLVCLLLVSTCFALESGPSNKVGYVKITAIPGSTAFGLPFVFWDVPTGNVPTYGVESRKPSDIIGTQANCGTITTADRIVQQGGTTPFAYRTGTACSWAGTLETPAAAMTPGRAYWYINKTGVNRTLVLAGEADITGAGIPAVTVNAPTTPTGANNAPYSWRDPREVPRNQLNLIAAGFRGGTISTSDRVTEQGGGARSAYYLTGTTPPNWGGTLPAVVPGNAYWLVNKHYGLPAWNYTYMANGSNVSIPGSDDAVITTQKIENNHAKTVSVKSAPLSNGSSK